MVDVASTRLVYDADGHIMAGPNWLMDFADEELKKHLFQMPIEDMAPEFANLFRLAGEGAHAPDRIPELEKNILGGPKGWEALGAFNPQERSRSLDLLNIKAQLIFSTFASLQYSGIRDPELLYRGVSAHNRAMGAWCSGDPRLLGVASVPLRDPVRAMKAAKEAIEVGCSLINLSPSPAGDLSPGHPDIDPFWRLLEETQTPFTLHIGSYRIKKGYMNNGRPAPVAFNGAGEGIMAKDFPNAHHRVEEFLTTICFDGVFERFPGLRGGVVEHGADWVPSFIRRLDYTHRMWAKSTPELREMKRKPSEQFTDQMRFTPGIWEDVAQLVSESNDRLYCFSTDYPHVEGGRDPFGKFEATIASLSEESKTRFYSGNFADLMLGKLPSLSKAA